MILDVRNIDTTFGSGPRRVHAVKDVSFTVGEGEFVGIVGESGSGKSTVINTLLGLQRGKSIASSGQAFFQGRDLMAMRDSELRHIRGARIGFVAQNPFGALNPILRLSRQFENVVRAHRGMRRQEIRDHALAMLVKVGIHQPERVLDGHAHQLSGGMAQRVVIAMALLLDPALIVADEPTTALDMTVQKQILDLIAALGRESRRSMLMITHDLGVVANYCDRVVVMYHGRVVEQGSVAEVFGNPADPYTRALLEAGRSKGGHRPEAGE